MFLRIALAAFALTGCQAVASPTPTVTASVAAKTTVLSSPSSPAAPTAALTTNMSPPPSASRLAVTDARIATDGRPRFLFQAAGENRLRAVVWSDMTNGVLAGDVPLRTTAWQSPDGKRYVSNGKIYDADGRELGMVPWQDPSTWSRDGEFLCKAVPTIRQTGAPLQLQTVVPGQEPRIVATGFGTYSDNSGYPVLACDAASDRVIVASFGQGLFAGHLWVFRLSTGVLIRSEDLGANAVSSWLAASADGTLLAHSVRATNTSPTTTTIRAAESPTALQTLSDFEGHGFSGDGSLLLGLTGGTNTAVAIIDWKAARRIWLATGAPYGGYFPEPGGAHFAVGLGFIGGAEDKGDVYIIGPDGASIALPSGVRAAFRY